MATTFVPVVCALCGADQPVMLYEGRDRLLGHSGTFTIVRCACCGLVYQSPRPEPIAPFYEGSYLPFESQAIVWRPVLKRHQKDKPAFQGAAGLHYNVFRQVVPWRRGSLLDVGCATGDFLEAMARFGWRVQGVEPHGPSAEQANRRLAGYADQAVRVGTLEQAGFPDAAFDVITLWHVIEHLPDPRRTLQEIRRILKPGGLCLIQTPCWGSLESFLFGPYWSGLDCPRHFWIFSRFTLQALAEQCGFSIWQQPHAPSYPMYALSAMFLAGHWFGRQAGDALFRFLHRPLVDRLASVAVKPLDLAGLGSQLTVALVHSAGDWPQ